MGQRGQDIPCVRQRIGEQARVAEREVCTGAARGIRWTASPSKVTARVGHGSMLGPIRTQPT